MLRLTETFHKNAAAYSSKQHEYIINQGGSSASKTFSILQILVEIARKYKKQIDIVGLSVPHLKSGVLNDMPSVMEGFGLSFHDMYSVADKKLTFPSGGVINFLSFDKLGKAHGGRRDILFINEANHVHYNIAEQLMIRTRETVFIDYNPTNEFWVHTKLMKEQADKCILIKSTYKDNQFLEDRIIQTLESKRGDGTNNFWRVYGMGELGVAEGLVFENFEESEFDIHAFSKYRNGIDWGFSNDPFAFVRVAIEQNTLYICEEIYQRGLLNKDSAEMVRRIVRGEPVRCDSAEPKSINEYNSLGVQAISVRKGPGSIASGIKKIQAYDRVVIHKNCVNVLDEFKNYQWEKDKNGTQMAEPAGGWDHAIDAIRYALEDEMVYQSPKPSVINNPYPSNHHQHGGNGWMR